MTVEFIQGGGADGMMPFVYGHVDPALFPIEHLQQASRDALAVHGASALSYGAGLGFGELRAYLREKLNRDEGLGVETDELMLTSGASAGLDTVVRLFTAPGDTVLVEAPSYRRTTGALVYHSFLPESIRCHVGRGATAAGVGTGVSLPPIGG